MKGRCGLHYLARLTQILAAKEATLGAQMQLLARKGAINVALLVSRKLGGEEPTLGSNKGTRSLLTRSRSIERGGPPVADSPRRANNVHLGSSSSIGEILHTDRLRSKTLAAESGGLSKASSMDVSIDTN